jgi:hypothetical protein
VSEIDFVLGRHVVHARPPPFSAWIVYRPLDIDTMRSAPEFCRDARALHDAWSEIFGKSL